MRPPSDLQPTSPPQPHETCMSLPGRRRPPTLPADTAAKRAVDAFSRGYAERYGGWLHTAVVLALLIGSGFVPGTGRLVVEAVAFTWAGGYCLLNLWRCREAHCMVTGVGWPALAGLTIAETAIGHSLIGGHEQLVFLGVLVLAVVFEATWRANTGTSALSLPPRERMSR